MKSSQLLEVARHKIDVGEERLICSALAAQKYALGHLDGKRIERLLTWIRQSLGQHITLEAWLYNLGYIDDDKYLADTEHHTDMTHKMRETRLAWLDYMINVCKKEGD